MAVIEIFATEMSCNKIAVLIRKFYILTQITITSNMTYDLFISTLNFHYMSMKFMGHWLEGCFIKVAQF